MGNDLPTLGRKPPIAAILVVAALLLVALASPARQSTAAESKDAATGGTEIDRRLAEEVFSHASAADLAPRTGDEAFLRRVYLDLVGQKPTANEVCTFILDPARDKRARLVDRLLADPRFGRNWARYWRDVILYRRVNEQSMASATALEDYLAEQFNKGSGWDEIARSFVAAKGDVFTDGSAALFMAQMAEPVDVASEMSRIFLGIQIQCAQCHDHPTERWKREQFHQFAAFFPRAALRRGGMATGRPSLVIASFDTGPQFRRPGMFGQGALEHAMPNLKDPTAQGQQMEPVFFATGQRLATGATDDQRRQSLADWMTSSENPWFAKAFVNRMWAELVGEGFFEPVDDQGPDRTPSAPKTLEYLAGHFAGHSYDVKLLIRSIIAADAYQRESRPHRNPDQPPFAANVAYRLRSDQLYDNLFATLGFDPESRIPQQQLPPGPRAPSGPRFLFGQVFGYDPSIRRQEVTPSIPQALLLMNSYLIQGAANGRQPGSVLQQLLATGADDEALVEELYLRCLARQPNARELAISLEYLRKASRTDGAEDLLWSLVNSKEFLYRR